MPTTATLNLNGIIMPDDWIWFEESGISLPIVQRGITAAGEFDDLTIFINSDGGVIEEGWAIYDYLLSLGKPITTIGLGNVYSMATILMASGTSRMLSKHSKFMVHQPGGGAFGNRSDIQEYLDTLIAEEARLVEILALSCGKDEVEVAELLADGKDHYYTADEALAYGWTTGIYQTLPNTETTTTAQQKRHPIVAHASAGRKGLGLPERKPNRPTNSPVTTPLIDMSKLKDRLSAAWKAIQAVADGEPLKNLDVDTADGKKLKIETTGDTYVVGDAVTNDDDTPVADGDYILSDGNTISVESGNITAIVLPENEDEPDAAAVPAVPQANADDAETVTIPKAEYEQLKGLTAQVSAMAAKQTEQDKMNARMMAVMKGMSSADPIEPTLPETKVERQSAKNATDGVAELVKQRQEARKK